MGCSQTKSSPVTAAAAEPNAAAKAAVKPSASGKGASPGETERTKAEHLGDDTTAGNSSLKPRASADVKLDPGMFITQQRAKMGDRYIRDKKIGSGAYGEVLLCRDKQTGAERAVKILRKADLSITANSNFIDEVNVVKSLDHPNIMKLYEVFEDKKFMYLVMEVYKGGELFDEIISKQKLTEADAANIIKQVLSGVTYLHKHNIVHRDLKPENLLLESKAPDAMIKIVDFGLSSTFDSKKKMKERLGTAYYIAPEVLKQKYDEKCDIWSCGVILYILLCGYPPFGGNTDREILQRVERAKFQFDPADWGNISNEAKDIIMRMLTLDSTKRISAEAALKHPWFQRVFEAEQQNIQRPVLASALGNMKKFQASQKLAEAALLFMGSKLTTTEETKELTRIFRSLDTNGDGQLDRKELVAGYKQLRGTPELDLAEKEIEEEVDKILEMVDFDKNGYIEYSEFVTVAMDKKILLSKDRLKAAFNMLDADGSGKIASDELKRILVDVDQEQWDAIMKDVDRNNDGEVDFDEFVTMMHRICLGRTSGSTDLEKCKN